MKIVLNKIMQTFKRYYITIVFFMVASIKLMDVIYNDYYGKMIDINETKFILTFIFGAIMAVVIRHIMDRVDKYSYLLYLIIPTSMIIVYFIVLGDISTFTHALNYFILILGISFSLFIIPFIDKDNDSEYYSYNALISLLLTVLCYILILVGLMFIIVTVSSLFEITIKDYLYPMISVFVLGFLMPTLFLSLIPDEDQKGYPSFINKMFLYLIYPILGIYTIILYSYFIKILILVKWPSNSLGNLTIIYLLVSTIILYFTNKMRTNRVINIYPYLLIVPNIMMLITFIIRINAYGFTVFRYYGIFMFIFVMTSLYMIIKKEKVKYILLSLLVLLLISVFGPLSASNISIISQSNRLENILLKNNMLEDNKIIINPNLNVRDKNNIIDIIYYFEVNHGFDRLEYLPSDFKASDMQTVFGFKR